MNNESLNHHLATVVMGWHKYTRETNGTVIYRDKNNKAKIAVNQFDPPNNIEQAMGCLEIFAYWAINHTKKGYEAMILTDKEIFGDHIELNESLPMAISLACAKATGWEE